jgi:rubrerythrin
MKLLIVVLAVVASACAYSVDDIPAHVRARLDRFVALKKQWEEKWGSMTESEREHYEEVLVDRLEHLPQIERLRLHDRIEQLPQEHREKLRDYLRRRFPKENSEEKVFEDDVDEIEETMETLPIEIREKIKETLIVRFQEATAYSEDEDFDAELDFEEVPDLVDIPEAVGYSESISDELREKLDEFLLKRENWRRKWERISEEKREALEAYINGKM